MRNRTLTMASALLAGIVGVIFVYMYVQRVEASTETGSRVVQVMVANRHLPAGTSAAALVDAGAFDMRAIPLRYATPGVFTAVEELEGLVVAQDIAGGEQLTAQRFSGSEQAAFFSAFPDGTQALALPLTDKARAVSGHLKPGDKVNVYVTIADGKTGTTEGTSRNNPALSKVPGETALLQADLPVMEVQEVAIHGADAIVVAVTEDEAAALVQGQQSGSLWFTLVPEETG